MDNPRANIESLIMDGDLEGLLNGAAEIHGHYCLGLAIGVKAAYIACKRLDIVHSDGMEKIMAVTECNNCSVDGIQYVSGCTLGNNALIYKDLGKTAFTFYKRGGKTGLRLMAKSFSDGKDDPLEKEADALFNKAVKRREELTLEESERFKELWKIRSHRVLNAPEDRIFSIEIVNEPDVEYAPIYNSIKCSVCGESVMETRLRMKDEKPICISCSGDEYRMIAGRGIRNA